MKRYAIATPDDYLGVELLIPEAPFPYVTKDEYEKKTDFIRKYGSGGYDELMSIVSDLITSHPKIFGKVFDVDLNPFDGYWETINQLERLVYNDYWALVDFLEYADTRKFGVFVWGDDIIGFWPKSEVLKSYKKRRFTYKLWYRAKKWAENVISLIGDLYNGHYNVMTFFIISEDQIERLKMLKDAGITRVYIDDVSDENITEVFAFSSDYSPDDLAEYEGFVLLDDVKVYQDYTINIDDLLEAVKNA